MELNSIGDGRWRRRTILKSTAATGLLVGGLPLAIDASATAIPNPLSLDDIKGKPEYPVGEELGFFIWYEEPRIYVRYNGVDGKYSDPHQYVYEVDIQVEGGEIQNFEKHQLDPPDEITGTNTRIDGRGHIIGHEDGFSFEIGDFERITFNLQESDRFAETSFVPERKERVENAETQPVPEHVYLGADRAHPSEIPVVITGQAGPAKPSVSFPSQESDGKSVVVEMATLPEGGYIVIHSIDDGSPGDVLGHSEYIEPGSVSSFTVSLDSPISEDQSLIAMLHKDTDDDQTYGFPDADGPYMDDSGTAVIDNGKITVVGDGEQKAASVTFADQDSDGGSVIVQNTVLPDGGYLVIHDESGAVRGHSSYLEAGSHSNITVNLDSPIASTQTLIAMAHTDDGDESYEFPDADGPYTTDGAPVTDGACITLVC